MGSQDLRTLWNVRETNRSSSRSPAPKILIIHIGKTAGVAERLSLYKAIARHSPHELPSPSLVEKKTDPGKDRKSSSTIVLNGLLYPNGTSVLY